MRLRKRLVEGGEGERDGLIGRQPRPCSHASTKGRFDGPTRFFSQQIGVIPAEVANSLTSTADGTFMEPSGRNQWQSVANARRAERAETSQKRCRRLQPIAVRSAW
jgi:hypothetical protein